MLMKLVFAIVHDDDSGNVMEELNGKGFGVTKLCSSGGFLKSGNTTLLVGVEEQSLDTVIEIIKSNCQSRKQVIDSSLLPGNLNGSYMPYPIEIQVGGATIFVTAVERYEKL
jgi:uncharacterized protein YaaQ